MSTNRAVCIFIVVPYVLNVLYVWENMRILTYFITWTNFTFFQQELLHSPDELPANNCRYITIQYNTIL